MAQNPSDKRVQVKIEVGHHATCRENVTPNGKFTHDWTIFVRGSEGADISHFVEKIVFLLHESFPKPKRVKKEPPYTVSEKGYGSFTLPIEIHFRNKEDARKYRFQYDLSLQLVGMPPLKYMKVESVTFVNPSEDFERKLIAGGAVVLGPLASPTPNQLGGKGDNLSKVSPASSFGSSPGSVKKYSSAKPIKANGSNHSTPQHNSAHTKRSATDESPIQKPKKKKTEKNDQTSNQKPLKEFSILSSASSEADISKTKTVHHTKKIKDRRKSSESIATNNSISPKHTHINHNKESTKLKGKEIKMKKEKKKSPSSNNSNIHHNDQQPKLQNLTIKRLADDAWSSVNTPITTNHNNNLISKDYDFSKDTQTHTSTKNIEGNQLTTSAKQNERVDALFAEFAKDDESNSEEDFASASPLSVDQKSFVSNVFSSHTNESTNFHSTKNIVQNSDITKRKKSKHPKNGLIQNGKMNPLSSKDHGDRSSSEPDIKPPNGLLNDLSPRDSSADLYYIYDKLNNSEDCELLQKVVDIVEETGMFEITSSTFDFDLKALNDEVIHKIRDCLEIS